ncbi:MAG: hypothetical protein IKX57_05510 [Oscillospiraceae bacterium]|nr:hypothetical protein [Oscillospiraceae bacterium]MBR5723068.1 hypothetical protein [Oscillospiraceae bacterium]
MYQEDYIIRQIRLLCRAIAKNVFGMEVGSCTELLPLAPEKRETAAELLQKIDNGQIREAEAELDRITADCTLDDLLTGMAFYARIGEMSESFLDDHAYNDVDLKLGLRRFSERFGSKHLAELLMP